jgi:hypothetical protein
MSRILMSRSGKVILRGRGVNHARPFPPGIPIRDGLRYPPAKPLTEAQMSEKLIARTPSAYGYPQPTRRLRGAPLAAAARHDFPDNLALRATRT